MQIDEEFKNLIPKLSDDEIKQLEENILEEGCREPLVIWNNTIIDGHNRYKICTENNIDFKTIEKKFNNREEAKVWIIKNQFGRRNLSAYDRGLLASQLEDLFAERAKENMLATQNNNKSSAFQKSEMQVNTTKELAQIAGISVDTMSKIKKIEKKAPEEVKKKVKSGEMSINQAYGYAKAYEYLENEVQDKNPKETLEDEQLKKECEEIQKQRKIQQHFMKTVTNAMYLTIDDEHIEAWLSDMKLDEMQEEIESTEKAIDNLKELVIETKKYVSKNRLKVVK